MIIWNPYIADPMSPQNMTIARPLSRLATVMFVGHPVYLSKVRGYILDKRFQIT